MKKLVSLFSILALLGFCVYADVYDNAGYLTGEQVLSLSEKSNDILENLNISAVIYTESEMSGYDAQSTADDLYENGSFTEDGILFYICKETREFHFSTSGECIYIFSDYEFDILEENVIEYLYEDNYYGAFDEFLKTVSDIVTSYNNDGVHNYVVDYENGSYYETPKEESDFDTVIFYGVVGFVVSLIIAAIITSVKSNQMNNVKLNTEASGYTDGNLELYDSKDIFLYSSVTKTLRPKNTSSVSSSSRSGSFHSSSSGRNHGGRGGKF